MEELTAELSQVQRELLRTTQALAEAHAQTSKANARVAEANASIAEANASIAEERKNVNKMHEEMKKSFEAQVEAEQTSLRRLRELGMVNARGIIEWAEVRSKRNKSERMRMNRFDLWSDIFRDNPGLADCMEKAGWMRGTLASSMLGLYASLSSDIHKDCTPLVSDATGGIIISVNDAATGVNATAAKVLLCLAKANFIRARLEGASGQLIEESKGLSKKENMQKYLAEESSFTVGQNNEVDKTMY